MDGVSILFGTQHWNVRLHYNLWCEGLSRFPPIFNFPNFFDFFFQILTPEILLSLFTQDRDYVTRDNETKALCTSEYSDISPLTGGNVVFTTLAGRASANDFENSPQLQVITLS